MISENFLYCLEHVLKREGGFVNNPKDRGGPTKFGITRETLSNFRGVSCTDKDIFNLGRSEASKIYELFFWSDIDLDKIKSRKIALIIFDQAVNRGAVPVIKMLQEVLNSNFDERLWEDGKLGPKTLMAISKANESLLCRKLIQACQDFYIVFATKNINQLIFLRGWINRTFALQDTTA